MIDVGHIELDGLWEGRLERRSYEVNQLFQPRARLGLFPHIELGVTENALLETHDHLRQEGNEISCRFAFWDYGTVPLNPSFEVTWHPRHDGPDAWEGRASIGFELVRGLDLAADGFFQGETGGTHQYTWGFHAGATYELVPHVFRVGAEGGVTWWFSPNHQDPFAHTDPEVGPTLVFRPLALLKPEWGNRLKLSTSCEFGLRDDNTTVPLCRFTVIVGCQF
jgi:hypothetical protein